MDSWKARQNAAVAMQGVAANLPRADQRAFFMAATAESTFLSLSDIPVEAVLEQGQVLYAVAPSRYLEQLDDDMEGRIQDLESEDHTDFVTQRIRLQRRILAERLGLAALEDALLFQKSSDLNRDVTNEDLLATYHPDTPAVDSNQRKWRRPPPSESDEGASTIQRLLVREMRRVRIARVSLCVTDSFASIRSYLTAFFPLGERPYGCGLP
jgi:hypothetical protein